MARFRIPNSASLHTVRAFLDASDRFALRGKRASLEFHPRWSHMEPVAMAMAAAWGLWCRRNGLDIDVVNLGRNAAYASRMHLFETIRVPFEVGIREREEAGRFLPVTQVRDREGLRQVIGDISALLHLQHDPEALAAVQYCISELLRNALEHSGSPDGGVVCAHRFVGGRTPRVSIAVADCGQGVRSHLSRAHAGAARNDEIALGMAMQPGVTGALPGMYGTPDNAGAGLFITRCIAKGTGGYFFMASGDAAYRLGRSRTTEDELTLEVDAFSEKRSVRWTPRYGWMGTVVAVEVRTDRIADYEGFFQWILRRIPSRSSFRSRIRFT